MAKVSQQSGPSPIRKIVSHVTLEGIPFFRHIFRQIDPPVPDEDPDWFSRGVAACEEKQYVKALAAWKKADNAEAHYRIGQLYAQGQGVVRSIPDAVAWYKRAAEAGHVEAQFRLGSIYANGAGAAPGGPDSWFKSASQRDGEAAQRNLDTLFPNGIAVEKDLAAALHWIGAAAASGKTEAQAILGDMCRRGDWRGAGLRACTRLVFIGRKERQCIRAIWAGRHLLPGSWRSG